MSPTVQSVVAVVYVADLDRSTAFYQLFDFVEQSAGADGASRWRYLGCGEQYLLLVDVRPALPRVEVPLSFYFYVADLAAVSERLTAAGTPVDPAGRPQHAPGGEARLADPDGNVLLIGQRTPGRDTDADPAHAQRRFRLLHEAAAQLRRNAASTSNGDAASRCQIGQANGAACPDPAEVKLADSWGDTAWACLRHADETLISAPGAFLASQDTQGLQHFLKDRQPRS